MAPNQLCPAIRRESCDLNPYDPILSNTRTRLRTRHALITPDGHVASIVPGI